MSGVHIDVHACVLVCVRARVCIRLFDSMGEHDA